ncbi:hypothetical protein CYLTODRAFT_213543 [Cylindrobasidium torrendii FP15055 ss-10]|uniref:Uncharacterized protein n=1 Tax=Cylindrobasidium torrendii FP15055 ss-10 TaxID=1314674 RepID=A0A0D7ATJ6_9AGAR|nr:hypothetical protein CYLTODRAFT_213543 [Cylindrobasidium torrendii FP15055 ss-10]
MAEMGVQIDFNSQLLRNSPTSWRAHESIPATITQLPPDDVCREILWEMNEINFRSDLVCLDRFLYNGFNKEDAPSPADRRGIVLQRFTHFGSSVVPDDSQFVDAGFALSNVLERRDALCSLVNTMCEWRDSYSTPISALLQRATNLKGKQELSAGEVHTLEVNTVGHFVRTFFGVFKRPPNTPRTLQAQS